MFLNCGIRKSGLLNEIELELKAEGIISHGQLLPFIIIHQKVWGRSMSGI